MNINEPIAGDFAGEIRPPRKFSWYRLAFIVLAPVLVAGLFWIAFSQVRSHARRLQCESTLRQVGLALKGYHDWQGCFPPSYTVDATGKPMRTWRTLIMPFLGNKGEFDDYEFGEPWDSLNNQKFVDVNTSHYRCATWLDRKPGLTDYVLIRGPDTAFPGGGKRVSLSDVSDDPSTTILAVEAADSGIHWAEPRDLDIGQMSFRINDPSRPGISGHHHGGVNVLMMDGSVRFLRDDLSPATVKALITIDGGEVINKGDFDP
jgi:prepilin-type processing-associated H-X9-DG protein